jgi:DNA polymerase III sliding clamp (beta) subunit (PCNA family)
MLEVLDFVKGAVATRDIVEVLTHFCIRDGVVQAGNGRITITSFAEELRGVDAVVSAQEFLAACNATEGKPEFKIENEHMFISRGSFRAKLPLLSSDIYPFVERDTKKVRAKGEGLYNAMEALAPFMAEDATRVWACGMLFAGEYAYATNNVVLARCKLPFKIKRMNIPVHAIDQMLKIKFEPIEVCCSETSVTFVYDEVSWMKTTLVDADWPDIAKMFTAKKRMPVCPEGMFDQVEKLMPFCPDNKFPVVRFVDGKLQTLEGDMDASVEGYTLPDGAYRIEPLLTVLNVCTHIDFKLYPLACPWRGWGSETVALEGVIIGVRV